VNMSNAAELKALLGGLHMVTTHGWLPVIIEGDS
jgi:ribonuclease HI